MTDIPLDRDVDEIKQDEIAPKPTDLRDEVAAAFKAIKEAPEGETAEMRAARSRDEQGKFVKEKSQPTGEARSRGTLTLPADKAAMASGVAAPAPADTGTQAPAVKAPESWTAAAKAKFALLDPDVQQEVLRRESDVTKEFSKRDEERNFGREVMKITTPYLATINAEGGTPLQAYQLYLNTAHIMRAGTPESKAQQLASVAQQFRVDTNLLIAYLQHASGNSSGGLQHAGYQQQQPQGVQPQQISELVQAELAKHQQIQETQFLQGEIESFAAAPGHEHFEAVKPIMGALLEAGRAKDLQDAYDRAIWADPEIRSTLATAQQREAEAKRQADAQARTDAARRAGGSLSGGPGGAKPNGATAAAYGSLDEEVRARVREAFGRV